MSIIETNYLIVRTEKNNLSFIENNYKSFLSYADATKYRDLKREIELLEKKGDRFNICFFDLVRE
jgi:hypothetical protein